MSKELEWIKKNAAHLNILQIEKDCGLPESTLRKYTDGRRELPEKWHPIVTKWVKKFTKI